MILPDSVTSASIGLFAGVACLASRLGSLVQCSFEIHDDQSIRGSPCVNDWQDVKSGLCCRCKPSKSKDSVSYFRNRLPWYSLVALPTYVSGQICFWHGHLTACWPQQICPKQCSSCVFTYCQELLIMNMNSYSILVIAKTSKHL